MDNDLKDILSDSNNNIDNQKLMDYLRQQISAADSHDLEKEMIDDPFMDDAVEGLQKIRPQKNLTIYVDQLNNDLQKQLGKSKKRREKRKIKNEAYTYFAVLLILLLLIICFNIFRKNSRQKKEIIKTSMEQIVNKAGTDKNL